MSHAGQSAQVTIMTDEVYAFEQVHAVAGAYHVHPAPGLPQAGFLKDFLDFAQITASVRNKVNLSLAEHLQT